MAIRRAVLLTIALTGAVFANGSSKQVGAATAVQSVRIVVVDISISMSGKPLEAVAEDLLLLAKQFPPTAERPIVVLPFDSTAKKAMTFTDEAALRSAVIQLGGRGGTNISAGLQSAKAALSTHISAHDVSLLLYTDWEDGGDPKTLQKVLSEIDALFKNRQEKHLAQSVYLRSWGQLPAGFLQNFKHATVGTFQLNGRPTMIVPAVDIQAVNRSADGKLLEIDYQAKMELTDPDPGQSYPSLSFHCPESRASGDRDRTASLGSPAKGRLTLALESADQRTGAVTLPFDVQIDRRNSAVFPILSATHLEVIVRVPDANFDIRVSALTEMEGVPCWEDPLALRARYALKLAITINKTVGADAMAASTFRIFPKDDTVLVVGDAEFRCPGVGTHEFHLAFVCSSASPTNDFDQLRFRLRFILRPTQLTGNERFSPSELDIDLVDLQPPDQVVTQLEAKLVKLSPAAWQQAPTTCRFDADLSLAVTGPLPPGVRITARPSAPLKDCRLSEARISAANQRLTATCEALLDTTPTSTHILLGFEVASGTAPAISVQPPPPLTLNVLGPPVLRLSNRLDPGGPFHISASADVTTGSIPLQLELLDLGTAQFDPTLQIAIKPSGTGLRVDAPTVTLNTPHDLGLRFAAPAERPYFRSIERTFRLIAEPLPPTTAIQPLAIDVDVVQPAPFVEHLTVSTFVLCALAVVGLIVLLFRRLRAHTPPSDF